MGKNGGDMPNVFPDTSSLHIYNQHPTKGKQTDFWAYSQTKIRDGGGTPRFGAEGPKSGTPRAKGPWFSKKLPTSIYFYLASSDTVTSCIISPYIDSSKPETRSIIYRYLACSI